MKYLPQMAVATAVLVGTVCANDHTAAGLKAMEEREIDSDAIWKVRMKVKEALEQGDTDLMMSLWSKECSFIQVVQGQTRQFEGWDAVKQAHKEMFERHPGMRITFRRVALHFLTTDVAIEDCTYRVALAENQRETGRDVTVLVKRGDRWLISAVRDFPGTSSPNASGAKRKHGESR
jgi:uncharacterized protein (TIGR02246 family)